MAQKINPRSLRHNIWYGFQHASFAEKNVALVWKENLFLNRWANSVYNRLPRFVAKRAPSKKRRQKNALTLTHLWVQSFPYATTIHPLLSMFPKRGLQWKYNPIHALIRRNRKRLFFWKKNKQGRKRRYVTKSK